MDRLPGFFCELVDAGTHHVYEALKNELRRDASQRPQYIWKGIDRAVSITLESARAQLQSDLERAALFAVLFRTHADQSRRSDAVDATLGVFLTALLVLAPLAFEKAPATFDRWLTVCGFLLIISVVASALFCVGGREPAAGLAAKLALDLRSPNKGCYAAVIRTINRAADKAFYEPTPDEEEARGAAGDLAQLLMQDRASLQIKRRMQYLALVLTILFAVVLGYRDVTQSSVEDSRGASSFSGMAVPSKFKCERKNSGGRQVDVRSGHSAASLSSLPSLFFDAEELS